MGVGLLVMTGCPTTETRENEKTTENCAAAPAAQWSGPYQSDGTWDFRGPLNEDRMVGDVVEDLVVDEAVGLLGVPSILEDEARKLLVELVDGAIRDRINDSTLASQLAEDPFYQALSELSAAVQVESTIDLEQGTSPNQVTGREEFHSVSVSRDGKVYELDTLVPVAARWDGDFDKGTLTIDQHSVDIAFSDVANTLISEVLGTDALSHFSERMKAAVNCEGLIQSIAGGDSEWTISLYLTSYDVSITPLVALCEDIVGDLTTSLFGALDIDTGIRVGGTVAAVDTDCDDAADMLTSTDFGGLVAIAGPEALAPRVYVSFEASRKARRAYADMRNSLGTTHAFPVRGRIVWEYAAPDLVHTAPYEELFQDEIRSTQVELSLVTDSGSISLGNVPADGEGYIDTIVSLEDERLEAGTYQIQVHHDSILAGSFSTRLLAIERTTPVVRSDVDKTYLSSNFSSALGLVDLLSSDATERDTLPAVDILHAQLDLPLVFLTGSPRFFSRTLHGKADLDQLNHHGLITKPFKDIVIGELSELAPQNIVPELKEQIGYKLYWLLVLRLEIPPSTPEILMGDDSEADHVVYTLYRKILAKELGLGDLENKLRAYNVADSWRDQIMQVTPQVVSYIQPAGQVHSIYIRTTGTTSPFPVADYAHDSLLHHDGTQPLANALHSNGLLTDAGLNAVTTALANE